VHQRRVATPRTFVALLGAVSLAGATLAAQSAAPKTKYVAPRAADGHADISGVWEHNAATPLERPDELAGRATLTDAEVKDLAQTASKLFDGNGDAAFGDAIYIAALHNVLGKQKGFTSRDAATGDYNSFWIVGRWFENRTSLITDPPSGKLPAQTAEAKARQTKNAAYRKDHPFDGPEDIALGERCITGNVPMLGAGYNNYYQITQAPTAVAVNMEMRHDTRNIVISTRKHLPSNVKLWLGDPVGHWEGDTFVVESTNFKGHDLGAGVRVSLSSHARVTEKFSRFDQNTLRYEVTVNDSETFTKPWTAVMFLKKSKDQVYEYACHEGNEAMSGTLGGERVKERNKTAAAKTSSKQ
jgi:hypothetical protein